MHCCYQLLLMVLLCQTFQASPPQYNQAEWDRIVKYGYAYVQYLKVNYIGGECKFHDYIVGGSKPNEVSKLHAPVAKLEAEILGAILGGASTSAKTISTAISTIKASTTLLKGLHPALGPALGLVSALLGAGGGALKPGASGIIKATNYAFEKMTMEINHRFEEMTGYVDNKIIELEKSLMNDQLRVMFRLWTYCINEANEADKNSQIAVNECQRDAYKTIFASEEVFLKSLDNGAEEIKRIEASLLVFREYAQLSLMTLATLVNTYKDDQTTSGKFYYNFFKSELQLNSAKYVKYAEAAVAYIQSNHARSKREICKNSLDCGSRVDTWWHHDMTCYCKLGQFNANRCEIKVLKSQAGQQDGYKALTTNETTEDGQIKEFALKNLQAEGDKYGPEERKVIEAYWEREILTLLPTWKTAAGQQSRRDAAFNRYRNNALLQREYRNDIEFSNGYYRRLENAKR